MTTHTPTQTPLPQEGFVKINQIIAPHGPLPYSRAEAEAMAAQELGLEESILIAAVEVACV